MSIKHISSFFSDINLLLYINDSTCTFLFDITTINLVWCLVHHQVVRWLFLLLGCKHINVHHCILSLLLLWVKLLLHHFFLDLLGSFGGTGSLHHGATSISFVVRFWETSIFIRIFHEWWATLMSTDKRCLRWGVVDLFDPPQFKKV